MKDIIKEFREKFPALYKFVKHLGQGSYTNCEEEVINFWVSKLSQQKKDLLEEIYFKIAEQSKQGTFITSSETKIEGLRVVPMSQIKRIFEEIKHESK